MGQPFKIRNLFVRNTGIQFAGQAVSILVALATTFILTRYLGVARFGGLNYVFAFYYFFLILSEMGVDTIVVRECSQRPQEAGRIISVMRTFKLFAALACMALAWIIVYFAPLPVALKPSLYIYGLLLPAVAMELPSTIFTVRLKLEYPSFIGIAKACFNFVFLITLVAAGLGMTGYATALVLSEYMVLGVILFLVRRETSFVWAWDGGVCRQVLRSSIPIALTGIFVAVINRSDFLMLERMRDLHEVGLYAAVYRVTSFFELLPLVIMGTAYPLMSRFAREDRARLNSFYKKLSGLLVLTGLAGGVLIFLFAGPIIQLVCGTAYLRAVDGLRIHIWASVCLYAALAGGNYLISTGKEKVNLWIQMAAASVNVALNLFWIPAWGFVGASAATTAAFAVILFGTLVGVAQNWSREGV